MNIENGKRFEIEPAFLQNSIPVVFEVTDLFIPYLSVAILSIMQNATDDYNYDVIILSPEMKDVDREKLESLAIHKPNVAIRIFNPTSQVSYYVERSKYNYLLINYYRLALPWILKGYNKIINLGADVLIRRDVGELFFEVADDLACISGVVDLGYQGRLAMDISKKELNLDSPERYINADVLVMNLQNIRQEYTKDQVMQIWQKRFFRCAEQDAINVLFEKKISLLPLKWNVFPRDMSSEFDIARAPHESVAQWCEANEEPYIVHYAALPKPWQVPTVGFGIEWWLLAKDSPYYGEMLQKMCEYILLNGRLPYANTGVLSKVAPYGSIRRKMFELLLPKGSKFWCLLKKVSYFLQLKRMEIKCMNNESTSKIEKTKGEK